MKTEISMEDILNGYINNELKVTPILGNDISHWYCQDTDKDGCIECYFYIKTEDVIHNGLDNYNNIISDMLGVIPTEMIEDDKDSGHIGEYRLEYIVNLKTFNS